MIPAETLVGTESEQEWWKGGGRQRQIFPCTAFWQWSVCYATAWETLRTGEGPVQLSGINFDEWAWYFNLIWGDIPTAHTTGSLKTIHAQHDCGTQKTTTQYQKRTHVVVANALRAGCYHVQAKTMSEKVLTVAIYKMKEQRAKTTPSENKSVKTTHTCKP